MTGIHEAAMCKVVFAVLIIKILFQGMKTYRYLPNSEWEIVENTATRNLIKYDCCPHPYGDLTFNLTLRRKVSFQLRLMLLPTLLYPQYRCLCFGYQLTGQTERLLVGISLFFSNWAK